jgi:hypothetical protein
MGGLGVNYRFWQAFNTSAQVTSCTAGNRTLEHAVSAVGTNTYSYDCNVSQTQRTFNDTPNQVYTLVYDAENRLGRTAINRGH